MKKSVPVRLASALAGLTLLALAACAAAEAFFRADLTGVLQALLASRTPAAVLTTLAAILVLILLALACFMMLTPPRPTRRRGFVMQKSENGPIGISVKAIEGLVRSCVEQQEAVGKADIAIAECRDGINVLLNIDQAAGVNIPLSVGVLQKQIKQYVTACTGVDVHEVRVLVENNDAVLPTSPYAVQDAAPAPATEVRKEAAPAEAAPAVPAAAPVREAPAEPVVPAAQEMSAAQEAPAVQETPAAPAVPAAVPPMMTAMPGVREEQDDRPLHQRLFGAEEQPAIVPAPPELVIEREMTQEPADAEEPAEAAEADADAADGEENVAADAEMPEEVTEETETQREA